MEANYGKHALTPAAVPGIIGYRDVVTITSSWPFGPPWLAWASLVGLALTVLIATPAVVANAGEKSNENPLRECLEADQTVLLGRRSIIAGRTDD